MVGMTLARLLRVRGFSPVVIERNPEGAYMPRGYMLGFQGYAPLEEAGVMDEIRSAGRDIAPRPDGSAVAIAVRFGALIEALAKDLPVVYEHTVVELVRDETDRVVGVIAEGPEGRVTIDADLVIACDGMFSPVRQMAGIEPTFEPLADAALTFMSPVTSDISFEMAYMSDGGHIGMLSWNEGTAGWRSIDKVGAEAATAPGLDAMKKMWTQLLPSSAEAVAAVT
jgi:2-polyprenyl-6-methoxyphenol hydroxylase-like FAD-dependent oxidoreductase